MWSEERGTSLRESEDEKREGASERASGTTGPLRWLFVFDGWRLEPEEDEFVLA